MKKFVIPIVTGIILGVGAVSVRAANAEADVNQPASRQLYPGPDGLVTSAETRFDSVFSRIETRSVATATRNGGRVGVRAFMLTPANARLQTSTWSDGQTKITTRSGFTGIALTRPGGEMR